jgi:carbonic anhydrase
MKKLLQGVFDYKRHTLPILAPLFNKLAKGQKPLALFFACSDSRVDPNLVTSALPGEIFTHRSVGNLIPPSGPDGVSRGDFSEAAAIEYALEVLKIQDIVVFGHSGCGAMKAALEGIRNPAGTPNLAAWLDLVKPQGDQTSPLKFEGNLSAVDQLSQKNVLTQMEHAATYPLVKKCLVDRSVTLHGAWFNVATGEVSYYIPEEKKFLLLDVKKESHLIRRFSRKFLRKTLSDPAR